MSKRRVVHNGVEVVEGWPERIEEAQTVLTVSIAGIDLPRIPYGDESEDWGAHKHPCRDCAVLKGQLHVPSCDVEQCPACGGQAIGCDCDRGIGQDQARKRARQVRPFSKHEQSIVGARRLFTWRHVGFAANGDATFEVENGSTMRLPFLTIGVEGPNLRGGAWLRVSDIVPGSSAVVRHDCYKDLLEPTEVEFFEVDDPTPATRDRFWEFKRLPKAL
ncbi:MAG TPA: hypothetical protein VFD82_19780 [Planctomycetota bacterium]|nr:hypothetical protein [Planctomycetota bacterium]